MRYNTGGTWAIQFKTVAIEKLAWSKSCVQKSLRHANPAATIPIVDAGMSAKTLSIQSPGEFDAAVSRAAALLRAGEIVALPTETVYGLAANALDAQAVAKIYAAKGRPPGNPIIVHVASFDMARQMVADWPESAERLAAKFWPGPLTMVLPRSEEIPLIVTAGGPTVGVRWPRHPFMEAVIRACGFPLAAPSANPSNELSPTTAEHVTRSLGAKIPLIIDGGPAQVGIESTVVDLSTAQPRLLRPGMISADALEAVLGRKILTGDSVDAIARSPGQLPKHYSPRAKLIVMAFDDEAALLAAISKSKADREKIHLVTFRASAGLKYFGQVTTISDDPEAYARSLYALLHRCDAAGTELIIVETPPAGEAWRGIVDRLRRAAQ